MTWFQLSWLHEISQSALAAAVVTLGLVILLELRSIKLLRRSMDAHLGRVFEQLDLMRFDKQPDGMNTGESLQMRSLAPVTASVTASPVGNNSYAAAAALASTGMQPEEIAQRCGLAAGEARLLASLAAARLGRRADA